VAARLRHEVPVGFKWFVDGLFDGSLGAAGAPSLFSGDGTVWMTDKDGIAVALLSAEITARTGRSACSMRSPHDLGETAAARIDAPASPSMKLVACRRRIKEMAGAPRRPTRAPGNNAPIGGPRSSQAAGLPRVLPAPRTSTRSTPSFRSEDHLQPR
jgi:phosphoglucomutase